MKLNEIEREKLREQIVSNVENEPVTYIGLVRDAVEKEVGEWDDNDLLDWFNISEEEDLEDFMEDKR